MWITCPPAGRAGGVHRNAKLLRGLAPALRFNVISWHFFTHLGGE